MSGKDTSSVAGDLLNESSPSWSSIQTVCRRPHHETTSPNNDKRESVIKETFPTSVDSSEDDSSVKEPDDTVVDTERKEEGKPLEITEYNDDKITPTVEDPTLGDDEFNDDLSTFSFENGLNQDAVDDIFNQLMTDIELWEQEHEPLSLDDTSEPIRLPTTNEELVEEHYDLAIKYRVLLREYNTLRKKVCLQNEEDNVLESQTVRDQKIILRPANFRIFNTKEYVLFITVVILCLCAVMLVGYSAVVEMEVTRKTEMPIRPLRFQPVPEAGVVALRRVKPDNAETKTQSNAIRTETPKANSRCFNFIIFTFCTGNGETRKSGWFS